MIGQMLAHYKVTAKIGEGGMGVVYRATDTKLGREVALKVLPEAFARDPERLARFKREAHLLASLNHPNIAAIYGIEERAIVMELVEGENLSGPLSVETAISYFRQIAAALEEAHEKGITHRDLKPANIKVKADGVVKVLDFGLAKAAEQTVIAGDPDLSPTMTIGATRAGVIMGTAAYMSPEQARGQQVDKRTDTWAFGVVLYEMLTGNRLFTGETVSDTLAAVLRADVDWAALPESTPVWMRRLITRCLEREKKQRLRDIGDAWLEADAPPSPQEPAAPPPPPPRSRAPWAVAALAVAAALGLAGALWLKARPVERPLIRIDADFGPDVTLASFQGATIILSPDGTRIVFCARDSKGSPQLFTRRLDQSKPVRLDGTEGAYDPFFSPDGQWIGFAAGGKLKKISVDGGGALTLCDAPSLRGASWGEDGAIIASLSFDSGLSRVPSSGGKPAQILALDKQRGEVRQRWPQILPGGKTVLFTSTKQGAGYEDAAIDVLSLDDGKRKTVYQGATWARYLSTGHLILLHKATLFAVPFDLGRLEALGAPSPVLEEMAHFGAGGRAQFDYSLTGAAVFRTGGAVTGRFTIQWLDRAGKTEALLAKPGDYLTPRFSPDGKRLALSAVEGGNTDIWIYEWQRDTMTRLTFDPVFDFHPVWTPDGRHIVYRSEGGLFWVRADGAGKPQRLLEGKTFLTPFSFTPDGKRLVFYQVEGGGPDLWTLPMESDSNGLRGGKPEVYLKTSFVEAQPAFSPDGRWLAYDSNETGTDEVYVRAFPDAGGKWQISSRGGRMPLWSRNGKELFFRTEEGRIMVAPFTTKGGSFVADKPQVWSDKTFAATGNFSSFDLAPNGQRFAVLMSAEGSAGPRTQVTFLLNFFDELRRRVPVGGGK